jgi:hypothetical protein
VLAYQLPGFALLSSAVIGGFVILAVPRDRLWAITSVTAAVVTAGMVVSLISLSI